ncbi:hypothetical protein [Corynebacterium kroppenstedtii]|uniref:hypothetical protein n=1 Tax=Corynebacterium kroppenstedtii TaxID=161879 RepID=UPI001ED8C1C3|nr:hypothetical protein [Corynebacterium kroppenstedtii]
MSAAVIKNDVGNHSDMNSPTNSYTDNTDIPEEDKAPKLHRDVPGKKGHSNPNRAIINNCPYCGSELLFPDTQTEYAWECRECCHVFSVKFHGYLPRNVNKQNQQ